MGTLIKRKLLSMVVLGMTLFMVPLLASSSASILLTSPVITPSPLDPVELKGEGKISFGLVENLGGVAPVKDVFGDPNLQVSIEFTNIRLKNSDVKLIKGSMLEYFDIVFNKKNHSMRLVQKKEITPLLETSIEIPIQVTKNTKEGGNKRNGFNANIAAGDSKTFADSSASEFTNTKPLVDTDGDKIPDVTDNDDDNDGILDSFEGEGDSDGDKIPDSLDSDPVPVVKSKAPNLKSMEDNKKEVSKSAHIEAAINTNDSDKDGILDSDDRDDDNDGIVDTLEGNGTVDTDGDKVPDSLDKDTDGDKIPDTLEVFDLDGDGKPDLKPMKVDANQDGLDDVYETIRVVLPDSDGDKIPDFMDNKENDK
jgi:hypothetical protein